MKDIIIAFDIDGVILDNGGKKNADALVKVDIIQFIFLIKKLFHNAHIIIWTGNSKEYAEEVVEKTGLKELISGIHCKWEYDKEKFGEVDIAIDDLEKFDGGHKNLIVKI